MDRIQPYQRKSKHRGSSVSNVGGLLQGIKPEMKKTTGLRVSAKRSLSIGISFTKYRQNVHQLSAFRSPSWPFQPLSMRLSGTGKNVKKVFKYNVKRGTVKTRERRFRENV